MNSRCGSRRGAGSPPTIHARRLGARQGIDYLLSEELLEVHPADATAWGLTDGDWCKMSSRRGISEDYG